MLEKMITTLRRVFKQIRETPGWQFILLFAIVDAILVEYLANLVYHLHLLH